jgi:hypothetical protein
MVTNIWYDPNWKIKRQQFVGKYNLSFQERSILITEKIKRGNSIEQAKRQVNLDTNQLQKIRNRNYYNNLEKTANENMEKEKSKEMKNKLLEGLGIKK